MGCLRQRIEWRAVVDEPTVGEGLCGSRDWLLTTRSVDVCAVQIAVTRVDNHYVVYDYTHR